MSAAAEGERIAKRIARAGLCSRRDAEAWIRAGRVTVNGTLVLTPALVLSDDDRITVDGQPLAGARVAALATWGVPDQAKWNVVSSFQTGADGSFSGSLPAEPYVLEVDATGYPWAGGSAKGVAWRAL